MAIKPYIFFTITQWVTWKTAICSESSGLLCPKSESWKWSRWIKNNDSVLQ